MYSFTFRFSLESYIDIYKAFLILFMSLTSYREYSFSSFIFVSLKDQKERERKTREEVEKKKREGYTTEDRSVI